MTDVSLSRHVLNELGPAILNGQTPPGTIYRIEDLQSQFGVSRTVMRDALRTLESMHMVEARRSIGITVAPAERWDVYAPEIIRWRLEGPQFREQLRSLSQLRAAIEPAAAGLAARQHDHHDLGIQLQQISPHDHSGSPADLANNLENDVRFHSLILQRCGNEMMAALVDVVELVLRARHERRLRPERPHRIPMLLHALVATAIRDGDAATAESAMQQLVVEVVDDMKRSTAAAAADLGR